MAHASGTVELTNRANLQLRGVKAGHEAALSRQLAQAGLGPQAVAPEARTDAQRTAVADDISNLMLSPCAGRDAHALHDTEPLARQILALLQNEPRFAALSPKFSVLLDGGERLAALDHPHDLWFSAMDPAHDAEPWFALGLAGQPFAEPGSALAAVRAQDLPALVHALLLAFIELATPQHTRMRDLLKARPANAIAAHAARLAQVTLRHDPAVGAWQRTPAHPLRRFGAHRQRQPSLWHVGGQIPLGRLDSGVLRGLARLAREYGGNTIRVTPWQGVLIPDIDEQSIPAAVDALARLGVLLDAANPLARLIACAGSAGCGKGLADTKTDALALARQMRNAVEIHLSGCERSCAAAHCAPYTLLAVAPERYNLYARPAAAALEHIAGAGRFGQPVAFGITIEEAARRIDPAARSSTHD